MKKREIQQYQSPQTCCEATLEASRLITPGSSLVAINTAAEVYLLKNPQHVEQVQT